MNKERYNQIIDSTYKSYLRKAKNQTTEDLFGSMIKGDEIIHGMLESHTRDFIPYTREQFINKIKTDNDFSEKWGLKIEERELSLEERLNLVSTIIGEEKIRTHEDNLARVDKLNIPTKLITVTYKDEIIEIVKGGNK
jgi:hypothetical protein